jgi:hypothetical protein
MNRIVLSEGKYDTQLLIEVYASLFDSIDSISRLDIENVNKDRLIKQESSRISRFIQVRNNDDYLFKSEGGKNGLKTAVAVMAKELLDFQDRIGLCILVDLDGGDVSGFVDDVDEMMESRSTTDRASLSVDGVCDHRPPMKIHEATFSYREHEYTIDILAFETTMEDVASISKNEDTAQDKEDKVKSISQRRVIQNAVNEVVFD